MFSFKSVIVLVVVHLSSEEKLPSFFKICNKNNPNLSKCIVNSGNFALPHLVKGVEELNIPPLINLKVPKIYAPNYVPYDFNFDGSISNLEGVTCNDLTFDLENLVARGKLLFPKLELLGKYKLHGFVGKIPMSGNGFANVTLHNVTTENVWTFSVFKHGNVENLKVVSSSLIFYNISSISYDLDNLFDGDKKQEETANQLLNKHWWILAGSFLPQIPNYITELSFKVISRVNSNTTLNDVFLTF